MQTIANTHQQNSIAESVQIGMNLPIKLVSRLDERARKSGNRSRSSVIREILSKEFEDCL